MKLRTRGLPLHTLDALALGALVGFVLATWSARGSMLGTVLFVVFGLSVAALRVAQLLSERGESAPREPLRPSRPRKTPAAFDLSRDTSHKQQKYLM
jgi:hypothetical protein